MSTFNEKMTALATSIRAKAHITTPLSIDTMKTAVDGIQSGTDVSTTTAVARDVLAGKYFYLANGTRTEGAIQTITLPSPDVQINTSTGLVQASYTPAIGYNNSFNTKTGRLQLSVQGAQTIMPGTADQTIAADKYLTGIQTIKGDSNLIASNIKKDVTIFNVTGTFEGGGSSTAADEITVTFGDDITDIPSNFLNDKVVDKIHFGANIQTIGVSALSGLPIYGTLELPNTLISLAQWAFSSNRYITGTITIPPLVTKLTQGGPFSTCGIQHINFNNVTSLDYSIVSGCKELNRADLPHVTSIGPYCFQDCTALRKIFLPSSVTSIGYCCFQGATALTDIYCQFADGAVSGAPWDAPNATVHYNVSGNTIITDNIVIAWRAGKAIKPTQLWGIATNYNNVTFACSNLPAGLSMTPSGLITGTPTAASTGVLNIVASADNCANVSYQQPYTIDIAESADGLYYAPLNNSTLSATYNGGSTTMSWDGYDDITYDSAGRPVFDGWSGGSLQTATTLVKDLLRSDWTIMLAVKDTGYMDATYFGTTGSYGLEVGLALQTDQETYEDTLVHYFYMGNGMNGASGGYYGYVLTFDLANPEAIRNAWKHVAVSYHLGEDNKGVYKLYQNGVLICTRRSVARLEDYNNDRKIELGGGYDAAMTITKFRAFVHELTASEIAAFAAADTPKE